MESTRIIHGINKHHVINKCQECYSIIDNIASLIATFKRYALVYLSILTAHVRRWTKILSSNPITFASEVWRTEAASSDSNPSVIPQPRSPSNHLHHPFSSHTREEGSGSANKLPTTGTKSKSWTVILAAINIPETQWQCQQCSHDSWTWTQAGHESKQSVTATKPVKVNLFFFGCFMIYWRLAKKWSFS